jgi:DNA-binding LytR/AlgR family response regulator
MLVTIKKVESINETQVEIMCRTIDPNVLYLERHIRLFSKTLVAKQRGNTVLIHAKDIFYIETIERRTFVYTDTSVLETDFRLYELEEQLADFDFFRASKSLIINLQKIDTLSPELNRTLLATMKNGYKMYISRQYTKTLKYLLDNKGGWL